MVLYKKMNMNSKTILSLFKVSQTQKSLFKVAQKSPSGRWTVHNSRETALKIKYATEDNCGISGIYKVRKENESYIYMMGYESVH